MPGPRQAGDVAVIQRIARLVGVTSVAVALSLPSLYFLASYTFLTGALQKEAQINAYVLSQRINLLPQMWRYEGYRLTELFESMVDVEAGTVYRVFDSRNRLVVRYGEEPPWPFLTVKEDVFESGRAAGRVEISQSLRGTIGRTALIAVLGALLGAFLHVVLRLLLLRALARAWEDLARSKMFVQNVLDNTADAIVSLDDSFRIVQFNRPAEKMFGLTEAEAIARPIDALLPQGSPPLFAGGPPRAPEREGPPQAMGGRVESVGRSRDGRKFPIEISFSDYRMDGKQTLIVMIRDITARRQLEIERQLYVKRLKDALDKLQKSQAMIIRAEKLSSMGTLTAGAAHEILNPANIIGLHAQRMQWENPEGSPARQTADVIVRNVGRITRICENLRRFSRDDSVHIEPVSLSKVVEDSLELFWPEFRLRNIEATVELAGENHLVEGDRGQLQQVLVNLVKNAMDAMPKGGTLSIGLAEVSEDESAWWELRVADTGDGIAPDILPRIFDPFFTTKPEDKGTGLGLSVSHGIIEHHGGKIWAESEPGKGTAFVVRLPLLKPEESA